jgi:hypothetical protein
MTWPILASSHEPLLPGKRVAFLAVCFALSCTATFVNPYGWRLHREIYESLTDRFMLEQLREWQPVSFEGWAGIALLLYLVMFAGLAVGWYRRAEPIRWILLAVFLGWSFWHWRNVTIFLVVAVPLVAELLQAGSARVAARIPPRRQAAMVFGVTVIAALTLVSLGGDHLEHLVSAGTAPAEFFEQTEYPIEAVAWVKAHRSETGQRLYNDYGYGGFLLWWMPGEKIFIDGRMPAWRIGERAIFSDYVTMNGGGRAALDLLEKYGVDWALMQRNSPLAATVAEDRAWREIYVDAKVAIMRRRP